jgi:large subunit ribosomal protein L25
MMATSYYKLDIENRESVGKKSAKVIRKSGKIPSVLYYKGEQTISISIDKQVLYQAIKSDQRIYEMDIKNESQYVMIKEIQYHPVTDEMIHVDFMRVRRSEKMTISVPITLIGKPVGVTEGGILSQAMNQIEISCYPTNVPEHIEVDVEHLELNSSVSVADVSVDDEDIDILSASDLNVASVIPPAAEEEPVLTDEEISDEDVSDEDAVEDGERTDEDSDDTESDEDKPEESN